MNHPTNHGVAGPMNGFSEELLSENFSNFFEGFFAGLAKGEHARVSLAAENTHFLRMSRGAVRQNGVVQDAQLQIQFLTDAGSTTEITLPFVCSGDALKAFVAGTLDTARRQMTGVPADPYANKPSTRSTSRVAHAGKILAPEEAVDALLGQQKPGDDLVGIYAGGKTISALADSAGMQHWFSSDSFFVDYSLWLKNGRAIKSSYAGRQWQQADYLESLNQARANLELMSREPRVLKPGNYRVFLAPSATSELLGMFSWGALAEGSIQRNESPFCALRRGEKSFSSKFSLNENFALGFAPRFSDDGELAPECISLFENGRFVQALVSARTQKEFGVPSNGVGSERLRTPDMATGDLPLSEAFKALGTGLYLSDLHYLNWSDAIQGRVTGMTRYGCLWVENGVPVGPIVDMRFDETLFRCFGSELADVTCEAHVIPETTTYVRRALGGARVPGMLVNNFQFTL
ncbi:TldD/PmbA family protein [bacterium]|nr:TldD/PmbA family protein [bacterium]